MSRAFYAVRYGRNELSRSFARVANARKLAQELRGEVVTITAKPHVAPSAGRIVAIGAESSSDTSK